MGTAQNYSDWYNSEPAFVKPLVSDFTDRIARSDAEDVETSTEERKLFEVPERAILPSVKPLRGNFKLLQMWEGRIVSIDEGKHEFTAIVKDKTNQAMPEEKLTMSIEEVPPTDLSLLSSGAVFYWSIGYADYPGRPRTRESRIRFRRLPKWHQSELSKAIDRGKKLAEFFAEY
jgi:hypothetical protein